MSPLVKLSRTLEQIVCGILRRIFPHILLDLVQFLLLLIAFLFNVMVVLQTEPEFRRDPEALAQAQRGIRRNASVSF